MPNLIGSRDAAKVFKVDRATFNRWVTAGTIPIAVELDGVTGARLFDANLINDLAEKKRAEKAAKAGVVA